MAAKRPRESVAGDDGEAAPETAEQQKRLRPSDILDFLDDDNDGDLAAGDLASVMMSLEQEINAPPPAVTQTPPEAPFSGDLGYLFGASDDELGLPPAAEESPSGGDLAPAVEAAVGEGFGGQIWGFEDSGGFSGVGDLTAYDDGAVDDELFAFGEMTEAWMPAL